MSIVIDGSAGIEFPATALVPTNTNTLYDYEEGTWTPTLEATSSNPTVTYTAQNGNYVKIGKLVFASCYLSTSAKSGGSGSLKIVGLPFTAASGNANYAGGMLGAQSRISINTNCTGFSPQVQGGTSYMLIFEQTNTFRAAVYLDIGLWQNTSNIYASVVYTV